MKRTLLYFLFLLTTGAAFATDLPRQDQRRFDYFYMEAVRMRNLGKYPEAYELYKHALLINPDAPEALFDMANFCNYLGSQEETQRYYERAAELAPQNEWYQEVLGNYYYRNKQLDKAIEVYERVVKNKPDKLEYYYELLSFYTQKQDYEKCIWALNRVESLDGKSEQISLEKYRMYIRMDQKDKAFQEMESLSKEYPLDLRYQVILGDQYLDNGEPERALEIYQQVLKEEPQNTYAQLSMVSYLEKQGKSDEVEPALETLVLNPSLDAQARVSAMQKLIYNSEQAKKDSTYILNLFDKALEQPQESADLAMLCTQYKHLKKMPQEEITKSLRQVVEIDPSNVGARLQLLQYAFQKEDFQDAIQICQAAVDYTPDEIMFHYYLGLSWYQLEKNDTALNVFKKASELIDSNTDKEMASNIYGAMGDIYHVQKKDVEAYAAYDKALEYQPDNTQVLNNYAYYLSLQKKDLDKAESMSYRTVKADPKSYNELDTYAWILFLEKKYTEAKIYIEESLKNGGEARSGIVEHAGDIFYKNGEKAKALEYWQKSDGMAEKDDDQNIKVLKKKIKLKKYVEKLKKRYYSCSRCCSRPVAPARRR